MTCNRAGLAPALVRKLRGDEDPEVVLLRGEVDHVVAGVDVVLSLITSAGDYVSEEIWYRAVQIITNQGDELQAYAAKKVWNALTAERLPHKTLVKVAGYTLGEFGHTIAEQPGSSALPSSHGR